MLTVIGLIVWIVFTIWLTIFPFVLARVSALGGGFSRGEVVFCLILLCLAAFNWASIFSIVSISINVG